VQAAKNKCFMQRLKAKLTTEMKKKFTKKYKLNTRHISGYFKMLNNSRMNVSRLAHSMQCFSIIFNVGFKRNGRRKDLRLFDNFQRGKKRVKEVF
jgi:hypothetical protein